MLNISQISMLPVKSRYGDLKKQLAEDIIKATDPIRNKINDILDDNKYHARVVKEGGEKARESASTNHKRGKGNNRIQTILIK